MAHGEHDAAAFCPSCGGPLATQAGSRHRACTTCGRVHHRDPKVAVGVVVHDERGHLLLVRRAGDPGRGRWALPAGFLDADEDPRAAAAREALEETGLVVRVGRVLDVYPAGAGTTFFLSFEAEVVGGELCAGDDASDAAFFALDELPELAFASTFTAAGRPGPD